MEFNSSSADSCSNSRRDNVWSESTSSEMIPAASIILGTSVCKDQSGSARHLESDIDLDTRNSDTMEPKIEFHEDPGQNKPLDEQLPLVEFSSLNSEDAGLLFENPHNMISKSGNPDLLSSDVGNHQITVVEGCVNDSAFTQQGLGVHLTGDVSDVSSQMIEENLPHAQAEISAPAPGEVICGSSEQDGKLPVSPGNLDPENVETLTTHWETQYVGEEEVIKGTDCLHNLRGQTSDGMETETHASSNPDLSSSDVGNHQTREVERCVNAAAFTHTQQVQYRAQIDVYVSLRQGTAPKWDSMVFAFGQGEIAWHSVWASAFGRELVATAATSSVEYVNRQIARRPAAQLPLLIPHLAPLPPSTIGLPLPDKYFLVDTPVKSRFFYNKKDRQKQKEFFEYMKKKLKQPGLSFQDAMNMCPLHGLWPNDPDESLPELQCPYDDYDMDQFRESDVNGYNNFLLSWPSTHTITEDGTLGLFEYQYSRHGVKSVLGQRQYLSCCVDWHRNINIAHRLSVIARLRSSEICFKNFGGIEFRGLTLGAIHDELDLMGVPRRILVTDTLSSEFYNATILWDIRYEIDGYLRFIFNLYEPNPCMSRDLVVYF